MPYEFKNECKNKNVIRALEDELQAVFQFRVETNFNSRIKKKRERENWEADPGDKIFD